MNDLYFDQNSTEVCFYSVSISIGVGNDLVPYREQATTLKNEDPVRQDYIIWLQYNTQNNFIFLP